MPTRTRILVDLSKDSAHAGVFPRLMPHQAFASTCCRSRLTAARLEVYDVLAICGQSLKTYSRAELAAIRGFVEVGGGLLLAADAAVFEFESGRPVERMAQNAVARLFGASFLSADCKGAKAAPSLLVRLRQRDIRARRHRAVGREGLGLAAMGVGPIAPPTKADVLLTHRRTRQPCAAAFAAGDGRAVMVGANAFAAERPSLCSALAQWLGEPSRGRRSSESADTPFAVGPRPGIRRGHELTLRYAPGAAPALDGVTDLIGQADRLPKRWFGDAWRAPQGFSVDDALCGLDPWHWACHIGAQAPAASQMRQIAFCMVTRGIRRRALRDVFTSLFSHDPPRIHFAIELLDELGFGLEADRCRERADRWVREMGRRQKTFDLARCYPATQESCPRGLALLREFTDAFGPDIVRELPELVPEKDPWQGLPMRYAWASDRAIHLLGQAAGQDMFPWFAERGLTVHPLPSVNHGTDEGKCAMKARLEEVLRRDGEALSSRMDAVQDLKSLARKAEATKGTGGGVPTSSTSPRPHDAWTELCDAVSREPLADSRATGRLKKLFAEANPPGVRAIAGLTLADLGDISVARELVELARGFETRFQLAVWYALTKAGSRAAEGLSIGATDDRTRARIAVECEGHLVIHGEVDGYRVCNNISQASLHPFTTEATISVQCVHWVHSSDVWRRRGWARHVFERAMNHPAARRSSCSELWTGTRNVAHPMYRSFGFTDVLVSNRWECQLPGRGPVDPPTDVRLAPYAERDGGQTTALLRELRGTAMNFYGLPRGDLSAGQEGVLAWEKRKLVGFAACRYESGDEADQQFLVVRKHEQRGRIADALLAMVHRKAMCLGAKRICWHEPPQDDYVCEALGRAGYARKETGGVCMMQIRNLRQFLQEIRPVLEKRLADSDAGDWQGTIDLIGERLKARLDVEAGKVRSVVPRGASRGLCLQGDDDTLTRIALGRETPFEAYLQTRLAIRPRVNEARTNLLRALFPKIRFP